MGTLPGAYESMEGEQVLSISYLVCASGLSCRVSLIS